MIKTYDMLNVSKGDDAVYKMVEVPCGEWVSFEDHRVEIERLRAALSVSRGQWIHSVNAEQCMIALGWEAEWREIQAMRSAEPEPKT